MFQLSTKPLVHFALLLIIVTPKFVNCDRKSRSQAFLGQSTQLFAVDLLSKLGQGNQLFSPVLIQSGLSILPAPCKGKKELIKVLHLSSIDYWTNSYKTFLGSILRIKDVEINLGSSVYLTNGIQFPNSYKKLLQMYGTNLISADFSKPDIIARRINQWVERKTNNKIHDMVDSSSLDARTEALLVTVLYFNGNWEKPFDAKATHPGKFYSNGKQDSTTNMMTQSSRFNYAENKKLDAKFLELPYKNLDYVMTIVLPNKRNGLSNLQKQVRQIFVPQSYSLEEAVITLPKFNFTNKVNLDSVLKKLGLTAIFDIGLSFSKKYVKVDKIIQKTYIDVNEVGTEAAAAMAVEMSSRFGRDSKTFNADHPFLFFIKQKSSGVILFLGRFTNV